MYIPYIWRNVFCNPWKVIFLLNIVNDDVVRFCVGTDRKKMVFTGIIT